MLFGESSGRKAWKLRWLVDRLKLSYIVPNAVFWWFGKLFGLPTAKGELWHKYGRKGIIEGYYHDLDLVLNKVSKIIESNKDKKIIITADHGERLGEWGRYGHGGFHCKTTSEVPWFKVNY